MRRRLLILAAAIGLCGNIASAEQKPLKVFVLVGQSNMQGHANVRTLKHLGMDPETRPLLRRILADDGTPRVCEDVWISSLSTDGESQGRLTIGFGANEEKIGPELTFGITMRERLGEPILLIKTAWGGKSLHTDFRPPRAGPYEFQETQIERLKQQGKDIAATKAEKLSATGHYYRLTVDHVKKVLADISGIYPDYQENQGYELAGLVWFQGWNDMVDSRTYPNRDTPGGYDQYSQVMAHFIRDVRRDLSAPELPIVIGVMGVGGPVDKYPPEKQRHRATHQNFRTAMAAPADLPEFQGNVTAVLTEEFWDMELDGLTARDESVKQRAKKARIEGDLSREREHLLLEELRAEEFSPQEWEVLAVGVSNQAYHYLGSAKIMARIGQGFAEAMYKLDSKKETP